MAKAPGITRMGTARDLADSAIGYVSSGESQWTRDAAGGANVKMHGYEERPSGEGTSRIRGPRSKDALIEENKRALTKLRQRVGRENVPARILKLKQQIDIKQAFIAKLESEGD